MLLSKTLHTELLKAAEQNGVNRMMSWGGIGAGVGGAYGMFSDTGTTMEGAFKGAVLGGGAAAGLKYYGNKYATGLMHLEGKMSKTVDFSKTGADFNNSLTVMNDLQAVSQQFNPAYIGIGSAAKFSDNILNATSINKRVADSFNTASADFIKNRNAKNLSQEAFIAQGLDGGARDRSGSIFSSSNSLIKDLRSMYGSVS